ncbi:hypothetical protein Tco_1069111 [Tanacetum coccineum]|uniref:Transposase n=1 Tax=Tanacetum coccineum TaxID=301880 RepID=A0ABQ5HIP2_9ASTR
MVSAAAKPCHRDSFKFYLIAGSINTDKCGTVVIAKVIPMVAAVGLRQVIFIDTCSYSTDICKDIMKAQNWILDLDNAEKPPLSFFDLMRTPIDFSIFAMNRLKISKLTKPDLIGPNNPEGNRCPYDLIKPLLLHESRGRLTVLADFFFNNDLEYLRGGSTYRKYTTSTTKTKAAKVSRHDVYSTMRILSVTSVTIDKWYGYDHLKEIVVRRADQKLYKFMEGNFPRLHLNIIEYMLLLVVQNRLNNLGGNVIFDLAVALLMYTRRIVLYKRVEDLQVGVESYQKKLNIPNPWTHDVDLSYRALYTTLSEPQGVIYEDKLKRKRLMRTEELYKFSDGTLTSVHNTLDQMMKNLRLGYNKAVERRNWTIIDHKQSRITIKDINQQFLERRIMRSLDK